MIESSEILEVEALKLSHTLDDPDISMLQIKRNSNDTLEQRGFALPYIASRGAPGSIEGRAFHNRVGMNSRSARDRCRLATRAAKRDLRYVAIDIAGVTAAETATELAHQSLTSQLGLAAAHLQAAEVCSTPPAYPFANPSVSRRTLK